MSFTRETFQFLADLEANNSKDWFDAHRADYEAHWKEAALDVISEVSGRMAKLSPALMAEPKLNGSLRRINRDVRFSKDKSPYSARLHMIFWTGGHPNRSPGMHFVLQPQGVGYGAGWFGLEPKALQAVRKRIVDARDGQVLIDALDRAKTAGCIMGEPDLKRAPKGFESVDGRRADLVRYKAITVRTRDKTAAPGKVIGPAAADWMMETTEALMPLIDWLDRSRQ